MRLLIENPKASFLLEAGLNILHQESHEWVETIAFWRDEMSFLKKLMHKIGPLEKKQLELHAILDGLTNIHHNLFDQLQEDVLEHEKFLARLEQNERGISDSDYRAKHAQIKQRFESIKNDLVMLKRLVFSFAKNW